MVNIPEFSKYLVFVMMKKMQDEGKEMMYIVTIGRRMIRKVEIPYTWRLQKKEATSNNLQSKFIIMDSFNFKNRHFLNLKIDVIFLKMSIFF